MVDSELLTEREKNRLHQSASESKLDSTEDLCLQVKMEVTKDKWSMGMGSKMLIGKVREWGKPITPHNRSSLQRKYKISGNYKP